MMALSIRGVDAAPAADGLVPRPRVVVVGVGHGGLECVKALKGEPVDILLVDRNNYHKFQPLLYQVATAGLDVGDITQAARHILHDQDNADFRLATVTGLDASAKLLLTQDGPPISYDHLVLAAGASTAYFGVEGAQEYAFPLKNVPDAVALRSHVLRQVEAANQNPSRIEDGALNIVVVGGGPTGVETAGAMRELFEKVLTHDFPGLDIHRARVILVDGADALMIPYAPELRDYTKRQLEKKGAEVRLGANVTTVTREGVALDDGTNIQARTVVWAAGIRANPLADALAMTQTRGGRVVVDESLRVPDQPDVFVAGDMAGATDPTGDLYPQVAQVAIQQGQHAADQILRQHAGLAPTPFAYKDLGMMATIGRNAAILQLPSGLKMKGRLAWLGWALIHVLALAGFQNKLSVMLSWIYNYITYERGPRLILTAEPEHDDLDPPIASSRPALPLESDDKPRQSHLDV
ncbi:MAG: NAD(P)/FAD-dependent oxidoreductase [Rubricoccaceae bacterium]